MATDRDELLWLFYQVHGDIDKGGIDLAVVEDDEIANRVQVMKGSVLCWEVSKSELLLNYLYAKANEGS